MRADIELLRRTIRHILGKQLRNGRHPEPHPGARRGRDFHVRGGFVRMLYRLPMFLASVKSPVRIEKHFAFRIGTLGFHEPDAHRAFSDPCDRFAFRFPSKFHIHGRSFLFVTHGTSVPRGPHILGTHIRPAILHSHLRHVLNSRTPRTSALFHRRVFRVFHYVFRVQDV